VETDLKCVATRGDLSVKICYAVRTRGAEIK